ncbi:MAG: prepilin-type N-terminal cleavage/methylation domain-containing protein [Candidatus Eremiobacteraeota bacterium]|nr:prepilin-type N-terminal cleavage/methylation domain-containing protein [Candidatus Eremiobacteraeota bacterium]
MKSLIDKVNKSKKSRGLSLIEIVVSLFIFVICILFVVETFPYTIKAVNKSRRIILATQLAKRELEFAKQLPWDDLVTDGTYLQNREVSIISTVNGITSTTDFKSYFTVNPLPEDPDDIKAVNVKVYWDMGSSGQKDQTRKVEMEILVAKD